MTNGELALLWVAAALVAVIAALVFARCAGINESERDQAEADAEQAESLRKAQKAAAERKRYRDSMRGTL